MRKLLLALAVLVAVPALVMGWPQKGDPAPPAALTDTAGMLHIVPAEYLGHVLQLFFWSSG